MPTTTTMTLPLARVRIDGGTWARFALDTDRLSAYTHDMRAGAVFPPVYTFQDPDGFIWLADGFHRFRAAEAIGRDSIEAVVQMGTRDEAFEYAVTHATAPFPLTPAERKAAANRMLTSPHWKGYSTGWIAKLVGLQKSTVNEVRAMLNAEGVTVPPSSKGSNGVVKRATVPAAVEGVVLVPVAAPAPKPVKPAKPVLGKRVGGQWPKRMIEYNGERRSLTEWSKLIGVPARTISRRLDEGNTVAMALRPVANQTRTFVRNGKTFSHRVASSTRKRTGLSPRVKLWLRDHPVLQDSQQRSELAALSMIMQTMVAQQLKSGAAQTVAEAKRAVLGGAPVDAWSRAFAAVTALPSEDQIRLIQQVWRGWTRAEREVLVNEHKELP